jgi:hypothetical protein
MTFGFLERHALELGEWLGGKGQRVLKKSHVRFFSGEASRKKISREKFFWEGLP